MPREALLLPNYDEYLVAYTERELMTSAGAPRSPDPRDNPIFKNTIVANGLVVGTWQRTLGSRATKIALNPFAPPTATTREALARAAERYRTFVSR